MALPGRVQQLMQLHPGPMLGAVGGTWRVEDGVSLHQYASTQKAFRREGQTVLKDAAMIWRPTRAVESVMKYI
jgi:hypothetical protein